MTPSNLKKKLSKALSYREPRGSKVESGSTTSSTEDHTKKSLSIEKVVKSLRPSHSPFKSKKDSNEKHIEGSTVEPILIPSSEDNSSTSPQSASAPITPKISIRESVRRNRTSQKSENRRANKFENFSIDDLSNPDTIDFQIPDIKYNFEGDDIDDLLNLDRKIGFIPTIPEMESEEDTYKVKESQKSSNPDDIDIGGIIPTVSNFPDDIEIDDIDLDNLSIPKSKSKPTEPEEDKDFTFSTPSPEFNFQRSGTSNTSGSSNNRTHVNTLTSTSVHGLSVSVPASKPTPRANFTLPRGLEEQMKNFHVNNNIEEDGEKNVDGKVAVPVRASTASSAKLARPSKKAHLTKFFDDLKLDFDFDNI